MQKNITTRNNRSVIIQKMSEHFGNIPRTKVQPGLPQKSKMEGFVTIVNSF